MKFAPKPYLPSWMSTIHPQVWILAVGRFLSEVGTGFTLFYAPIFFVNQVGLTATSVGFALGSGSIAGILGRLLGGLLVDSHFWKRRRTLLLATGIAAIGSSVLAFADNFVTLIIGNLIYGFATGMYWVPTEAVVADLTANGNRREAFAVTRLADNLGLGMGITLAGVLVATTGNYRLLFAIDAISFAVFFAVIWIAIKETFHILQKHHEQRSYFSTWINAIRDYRLCIYVTVNIIFTTYISQLHSTLPIYFKNFVTNGTQVGFTETAISSLFALHLAIAIFSQLPIARILSRLSHPQALTVSAMVWALGFILIWLTSISTSGQIYLAAFALSVFAIAVVCYTPSAVSLVSDLAPESQRGVYLSINSLCWACGYFIGPTLGGWALDQSQMIIHRLWLGFALSVVVAIVILQYLARVIRENNN